MHLRLWSVSYGHADHTLFENITLELFQGERVALLGRNGEGKTSLLRLLAGLETPHSGTLERMGSVAYLAQRECLPYQTLGEVLWPEALERAKHTLEQTTLALEDPTPQNLERYAQAEEVWRTRGGYDFETHLNIVLEGLDLSPTLSADSLSGGQTRRALLARLLLEQADFYLLDEPTNHLDGASRKWLEDWILESRAAFLIVSHDRAFLDRVVNRTYELERGKLEHYSGNYSAAMAEKAVRLESARIAYQSAVDKKKALETEISREASKGRSAGQFNSKRVKDGNIMAAKGQAENASVSHAKRVRAMAARLERLDLPEKPYQRRELTRIPLEESKRGAGDVLTLEHLTLERGGKTILQDVNLFLRRGEKVALLGPNGAGKSTLLEALLGQLEPVSGTLRWGSDLQIYSVGQQGQELEHFGTLEYALLEANETLERQEIYERLAFLGLPKDPLHRVEALSGGERTRLSLARLSVTQAQVMVLDEPTNHLDLEAIEALEGLLLGYEGTVIFASHDSRLVEKVASRALWVEGGKVVERSRVDVS